MSGMILDATGSDFRIVFSIFAGFYFISAVLIMKVSGPVETKGEY